MSPINWILVCVMLILSLAVILTSFNPTFAITCKLPKSHKPNKSLKW